MDEVNMTDEEKAEKYKESKRLHCIPKERYIMEAQESRLTEIKQAFLAGLKASRPKWHKLDWEEDFPDVDKLVRVRTKSGEEYICETYAYQTSEDEIGYSNIITQFDELNGDWVDDNEIEYWCYVEPFNFKE